MESAGPKQFENSRIYLQWLNFRGAWPMKLDRRAMRWLWGTAIFLLIFAITGMIWFSIMGLSVILYTPPALELFLGICLYSIGFFALVLPVIYMLVDFLVHVPKAIHDDTTSTMLQAIMVTPVTTRSILKDLTAWSIRLSLGHLAPSLLVPLAFIITINMNEGPEGYNFIILLIVLFFLIVFALLWHFLHITGLALAAFPRCVWSTGSSLIFWSGVIWFGWYYFGKSPIVVLIAVILLEIPTLLLAWYLPRLMSIRRSGEWR